MTKQTLSTPHLILRKVKLEDIKPMFNNWANDNEVTKFLTWNTHQDISVTETIVKLWIEEENKPETIRYMITTKDSDEPIGSIDVVNYINGNPEIGYCLSRKYWNKGYMTEACKCLIQYLFDRGFKKILIEANVNNIASNKVIQKCGFKFTHQEYKEHTSMFKPEPITVNWYALNK